MGAAAVSHPIALALRSNPVARRPRGSLSAEEILDAAWALVLEGGLDALRMPALARRLGAGVTSIYWYFRTKDELLLALAERATDEFFTKLPPMGNGRWDEELQRHFRAFRAELNRTPVYVELFSLDPRSVLARPAIVPVVAQRLEREVGMFVALGVAPRDALRLYATAWTYTHGFVLLELGVRRELVASEANGAGLRLASSDLVADDFPLLTQPGVLEAAIGHQGDRDFEAGLRAILLGLAAHVPKTAPRPSRRGRRSFTRNRD
jgi:AcrR family transcriptional regulator